MWVKHNCIKGLLPVTLEIDISLKSNIVDATTAIWLCFLNNRAQKIILVCLFSI